MSPGLCADYGRRGYILLPIYAAGRALLHSFGDEIFGRFCQEKPLVATPAGALTLGADRRCAIRWADASAHRLARRLRRAGNVKAPRGSIKIRWANVVIRLEWR